MDKFFRLFEREKQVLRDALNAYISDYEGTSGVSPEEMTTARELLIDLGEETKKAEHNKAMLFPITLTAEDWQLFTSMRGSKGVAKTLNKHFNNILTKAIERIKTGANPLDIAKLARDAMYSVMDEYSSFGARDTEPECVLVETIEKVLMLPNNSLTR